MEQPAISFIMPCHNRAHELTRVLKSYEEQIGEDGFEVIAVDDASTDGTPDVLGRFRPSRYTLRFVRLEENGGPGRARNAGIPLARGPLIAFVGDDIRPHRDFVRRHLDAHRFYPEHTAAILGHTRWPEDMPVNTLMKHIDGRGAQQFSYYYLESGQTYDYRHFYTSNVSLKTDLLLSLDHWFDPDLRLAAFEDVELGFRLVQKGMTIRYIKAPLGYHYHYTTIWSFAERQRRAGLMGCVLAKKRPELTRVFEEQFRRLERYSGERHATNDPALAEWLEAESLKLASSYEWSTHALLDGLYLALLQYFYEKGWIEAHFADDPSPWGLHASHARLSLAPLLASFLQHPDPLPFDVGYGDWLRRQCVALSRRF
jgi:glycosyltransferase involved in cell wall biosynthesis